MLILTSPLLRHTGHYHHFIKHISTATSAATTAPPQPPAPLTVPLSHPIYLIWSSNTALGKTLVSAGIAASSVLSHHRRSTFLYLKPIQTGYPTDSDSHFVFSKLTSLASRRIPNLSLLASNHVLKASASASHSILSPQVPQIYNKGMCDLEWCEERRVVGDNSAGAPISELVCKTMYAWGEPVSPHLAAERESGAVEDSALLEMLESCLEIGVGKEKRDSFCVIETAGGVASPGPSGSLQCDLYRYFKFIVWLYMLALSSPALAIIIQTNF